MRRRWNLNRLPDLRHERALTRQGCLHIAGVDEVGRGAWAGPVVAAAVGLPLGSRQLRQMLRGVRDSKQMSPQARQAWEPRIRQVAWGCAIGEASVEEIDTLGIVPATRLAMLRAAAGLGPLPDGLLIDYLQIPDLPIHQLALKFGDQRSLSIAAASVVAKVHRDRLMVELGRRHPGYGLPENKGYGTAAHRAGLVQMGPSGIHRRTFAPVAACLKPMAGRVADPAGTLGGRPLTNVV
jgi:ribonuclease HII